MKAPGCFGPDKKAHLSARDTLAADSARFPLRGLNALTGSNFEREGGYGGPPPCCICVSPKRNIVCYACLFDILLLRFKSNRVGWVVEVCAPHHQHGVWYGQST